MGKIGTSELLPFLNILRRGIWIFGLSSWLFGIVDRSIAAFADSYLSATDLVQVFIASFFTFCWALLKPNRRA